MFFLNFAQTNLNCSNQSVSEMHQPPFYATLTKINHQF